MVVLVCSVGAGASAAYAGSLPDGRRYELVTPTDKSGGDVFPMTFRTHAASDGNALAFASLTGFGDARGTGVTVDYLAQRSPEAGTWITHALTPTVSAGSASNTRAAIGDTIFQDLSPDLTSGVLESGTPVGDVGNVRDVPNLYVRHDLFRAGAGSYGLMTGCPACDASGTPLPPVASFPATLQAYWPRLAATSPDFRHAAFESIYDLTSDAPAQTTFCGDANGTLPPPSPAFCATRVYEWDNGAVSLAGRIPAVPGTECDDVTGPACVPADMSFAGDSARNLFYTPHVVSDGSDGHTRVMFTQPTASDGRTFSQLDSFSQFFLVFGQTTTGNLFMRIDNAQTVQLNVSERASDAGTVAQGQYLDASPDGERVLFMSGGALTDDATPGIRQIYMYDTAAQAGHHLTLLTPNLVSGAQGLLGMGGDGHYVYLMADNQILVWHDGTVHFLAPKPDLASSYLFVDGGWSGSSPIETRVTPDGRHLLYVLDLPPAPGGYDHGVCSSGFGCRELYVYDADTNAQQCVSCNPTGARATVDASVNTPPPTGGGLSTSYLNHALSDDGTYVFFNSQEALVPEAVNGKVNAYEFNTVTGRVALLSTGTSASDAFLMDASTDGRDAFIATRDQLVGWDRDSSYDIYDARIGGGLPEPPPVPPACSGGTCQGALSAPPAYAGPVSSSFVGVGNAPGALRARAKKRVVCRRGFVRRTVRGKQKCVKVKARARRARRASSRSRAVRATRRGA